MIISTDYPPNYIEIKTKFDIGKNVVFTYENTIYNPDNGHISKPLMKHEETHAKQQASIGVELWWKKYFEDNKFRLSQELEAYRNQFREAKKSIKNRNARISYLKNLAIDLSGRMYGGIIDFYSAMDNIKNECSD